MSGRRLVTGQWNVFITTYDDTPICGDRSIDALPEAYFRVGVLVVDETKHESQAIEERDRWIRLQNQLFLSLHRWQEQQIAC